MLNFLRNGKNFSTLEYCMFAYVCVYMLENEHECVSVHMLGQLVNLRCSSLGHVILCCLRHGLSLA